jgi:sugar O-acyltransferase (sialic acid O-acetyltransferase NeuD family)
VTPAVVVGAGGHGRVVAEIAVLTTRWEVIGFVDDDPAIRGTRVLDRPVLGSVAELTRLRTERAFDVLVGVGGVGDNGPRQRLFDRLRADGFPIATVVHPSAVVSPSATIGVGSVVAAAAVIGVGARIGDDVICNTGCLVDHDCVIGDHTHLAPGVTLSGTVTVGVGAHIGTNATVIQGVRIGRGALVGAGAVVTSDVADDDHVVGVPAHSITSRVR